ncbi:MAG: hypothetical protein ACKOX3_07515 [Bacteroidota bacterium]
MKNTTSILLMLRKSSCFTLLFFLLNSSCGFGQLNKLYSLSLDTNGVFSSDAESRDLNKWYFTPDGSQEKSVLGPLQITYLDSNTFYSSNGIDLFSLDTNDCKELKFNSDSCIIIANEKYKWTFIPDVYDSTYEVKVVGSENRKFYTHYGLLPTYLGYFPAYNLAVINLVDINGAYAVSNLLDLNSGKMIHDLSEYDNGTFDYLASDKLILSYSSAIFDNDESEIHFIKILPKGISQFCLELLGTLVISDYSINKIKWFHDNDCFVQLTKSNEVNQSLFLKIAVD